MDLQLVAIAIPVFFAFMALEAVVAWWTGKRLYRSNDALTALSCGIASQITALFTLAVTGAAYIALYTSVRLFDLPDAHPATWLLAFVLADLGYYGWHRFTHENNVGWATHVVHHQAEDYNLAVALRQSATEPFTNWPFYLPMALLGISPFVAISCIALNTLYQFFLHTELIGSLGPIGRIFNTPSHHRVHHGINPQYLDKNYGGVFIVWDRLFGTFEPEVEPPVYGTVKPLRSWNPLWANVWWAHRLVRQAWHTPRWSDKLNVFRKGPTYVPPGTIEALGRDRIRSHTGPSAANKYDQTGPPGTVPYIALHFVPVAVISMWVLWTSPEATTRQLLGPSLLILLATVSWAGLLERRWWALPVEAIRLMGMAAVFAMLGDHPAEGAIAGLFFGGSTFWLIPRFWPYLPSFRSSMGPRRRGR